MTAAVGPIAPSAPNSISNRLDLTSDECHAHARVGMAAEDRRGAWACAGRRSIVAEEHAQAHANSTTSSTRRGAMAPATSHALTDEGVG